MVTVEIQSLSKELTNEHISMPYPHVKVLEPSDAMALMITSLPKGDLAVICEYNGSCRQIGSIRKSAKVIRDLSYVTKLTYSIDKETTRNINSVSDILEVLS